ncbi:MAG: 50S ribosomal protein L29 [Lawsonibacter sp.]|nr:50S ribosomal protein L29 [Lawsonibacter sp.]
MKASEIREIRKLTPEQLNEKLTGLKKDLFYLRMQHATNQLDNPVKIRETKHDIARVKTVLRELSASGGQAVTKQ